MAKFQPIEYSCADEALLPIYDEILATLKLTDLPEWVVYLGGCPHLLSGLWQMVKGTLINGELNPLLQELILFCVSRTNGAPYCTEIHAASTMKLNSALTYHDLLDISCGNTNAVLPDHFNLAIEMALEFSQLHCQLNEKYFPLLSAAEFSESEMVDVVMLIALGQMFNAYTIGAKIPINSNHSETAEA